MANGRYEVGQEINRGGTAVVYEGYDSTLRMKVALKVRRRVTHPSFPPLAHSCAKRKKLTRPEPVPQVMNVTPEGTIAVPLESVRREINYARKIAKSSKQREDANVVHLLNVVQEGEGVLILVWELVRGLDVLDYLNDRGGHVGEDEARHLFRQLLAGIACVHDNGFCHRDIKPENCMIETATGVLKIIDFGLSKHLDSARTLGIGTPDYMAPEMLMAASNPAASKMAYDPEAVDVWAMGVMLYLMLTGRYPFEDPKQPGVVTATLMRVKAGRMTPLPAGLSVEVRDLIGGMCRTDPRRRARIADIVRHPWVNDGRVGGASSGGGGGGGRGEAPAGPSAPGGGGGGGGGGRGTRSASSFLGKISKVMGF